MSEQVLNLIRSLCYCIIPPISFITYLLYPSKQTPLYTLILLLIAYLISLHYIGFYHFDYNFYIYLIATIFIVFILILIFLRTNYFPKKTFYHISK